MGSLVAISARFRAVDSAARCRQALARPSAHDAAASRPPGKLKAEHVAWDPRPEEAWLAPTRTATTNILDEEQDKQSPSRWVELRGLTPAGWLPNSNDSGTPWSSTPPSDPTAEELEDGLRPPRADARLQQGYSRVCV